MARRSLLTRVIPAAAAAVFGCLTPAARGAAAPASGNVDFNRDVRPILSQNCFKCHGADEKSGRKAKLRLDVREAGALLAGKSGHPAVVPGKPDDSELVRRILSDDDEEVMPPASTKVKLTDAQKQVLKRWVAQGADYAPHWAFVPPVRSAVPAVKRADWARNPIDAFVLARLEKEGMKPSPEADKVALARRVYLDLIGLPPTPEEADEFAKDESPDAYERLVDRLLASSRYGERWARRWLDLARYADTNGFEKDRPRSVWAYRDWVIQSLNADLPFDQFTVQQLAGDLLPPAATPRETLRQQVATGFHRNTMRNEEGGSDPLEYRFYSLVDRVGTTGATWLGMTVACAQCHTHKYDPITHKEYYGLMAFFNNADEPELNLPSPDVDAKRAEMAKKAGELTAALADKWPVGDAWWESATASRAKAAAAADGVKLEPSADDSWRAAGPVPDKDTYTFQLTTDLQAVDRIKVEALLGGGAGPGRTPHGNFVLTELTVKYTPPPSPAAVAADGGDDAAADPAPEKAAVEPAATAKPAGAAEAREPAKPTESAKPAAAATTPDAPAKPRARRRAGAAAAKSAADGSVMVKLLSAQTEYSQPDFPVANAVDGKPGTGWAVAGDGQKDRAATFKFDKPVAVTKGGKFTVVLDQQYGTNHTIGRLRLNLGMAKPDDGTVADRRKQAVQDRYRGWLDTNAPKAVEWTAVRPADMKSNAPTLRLQPDDSVLANGDITKSDTYELTYRGDFKDVTAVRLEAIPDPSLPKGGPGMVFYEGPPGDFSLSNVALWADGTAGKFAKAAASFAAGGMGADKAIDDNLQTGWMINGGQGKPHVAVFALDKPLSGKELKLALSFEKYYAAALGRFRVSVTTDPRAAKDPNPQPPAVDVALRTRAEDRSAEQEALLFRQFLNTASELATARAEIDKVVKAMPEPPTTLVMVERDAEHARTQHLYNRGEFLQPAEEIKPGVLSVLPPLPAGAKPDRLAFARWLVSPSNPLTARVTVNRQWQAFFGRGIVRTTDDFGYQGDLPTHPELLDWLAVEFVTPADGSPGWSMKRLHKLIVTSSTYRQSSAATAEGLAKDPQNLLLGRAPRFRAEAEIVRDAALRAAGLLSGKMFGPSVFPPQPASVTSEGTYGRLAWTVSAGEDRYRRSLYTFSKRTAPFAAYNTFDAPTGEACVARREVSNTPLQALTLLNDQVFVEAAQALGKRAASEGGADDAAKAAFVFRRVLTRAPAKDEVDALVAFAITQPTAGGGAGTGRDEAVGDHPAKGRGDDAAGKGVPKKDASEAKDAKDAKKEDAPLSPEAIERAVWTAAARAVMNLDEAVVKS